MKLFIIGCVSALRFLLNSNNDDTLKLLSIGRVEISYNGKGYTICPVDFDASHAEYLCRAMGYERHRWFTSGSTLQMGNLAGKMIFRQMPSACMTRRRTTRLNCKCWSNCTQNDFVVISCKPFDSNITPAPRQNNRQCVKAPRECYRLSGELVNCRTCREWRALCPKPPEIATFFEGSANGDEIEFDTDDEDLVRERTDYL